MQLGNWQLDRAREKETMLAARELASTASPLQTLDSGISIEDIVYRNVELSGRYDYSRQFLLDNRIYNKQAGYEVITPFYLLPSGAFVLVNRGWIGNNGDRRIKPAIPAATDGDKSLSGIMTNPSRGFAFGNALSEQALSEQALSEEEHSEQERLEHAGSDQAYSDNAVSAQSPPKSKENWPLVLQYIDYATIADKVDKIPVVNGVIVADRGQNGRLTYNWQPVANGPMKHYGYAFQWFAMLAAVVFLFVYLNFIKKFNE